MDKHGQSSWAAPDPDILVLITDVHGPSPDSVAEAELDLNSHVLQDFTTNSETNC